MRSLPLATILMLPSLSSAVCVLMVASPPQVPAAAPKSPNPPPDSKKLSSGGAASSALHLVRRIHIGALVGDGPERTRLVQRNLRTELQMAGFDVVDEPSAADAVLSAKVEIWIVLDGDERDQRDNRYRFQLTLSTTGAVLWKAKVPVSSGQRVENEARDVAKQASRKLSASWRKSARKAGMNATRP